MLGFPDPASEVEATGAPAHRSFSRCLQLRLQVMVGLARPSVLEKVDEVLRGHRREAAVRVSGRAGVARVLPEEDAAMPAEVQGVSVLLLGGVVLLKRKIHQLPLHMAFF